MYLKEKIMTLFMAVVAVGIFSMTPVMASPTDESTTNAVIRAVAAFGKYGAMWDNNKELNTFAVGNASAAIFLSEFKENIGKPEEEKSESFGEKIINCSGEQNPEVFKTALLKLQAYVKENENYVISIILELETEGQTTLLKFLDQSFLEPQEVIELVWRQEKKDTEAPPADIKAKVNALTAATPEENQTLRVGKNEEYYNSYIAEMEAVAKQFLPAERKSHLVMTCQMSVPYVCLFGPVNSRENAIVERAFLHNILSDIKELAEQHMAYMADMADMASYMKLPKAKISVKFLIKADITAQYLINFTRFITDASDALKTFINYVSDPEAETPEATAAINGYVEYIRYQEAFQDFRQWFSEVDGGHNLTKLDKALTAFFAPPAEINVAEDADSEGPSDE